ncbi:hypothetical protein [Sulfuricurvum sp.]|uniref:hypothetical protein n=1 Tax=Sulfuricurvum sp. TaxID=2025608 RepID=UPI003BAF736F
MKIYEAIKRLEDSSVILRNQNGELFQNYNSYSFFVTYSDTTRPTQGSIGGSIKHDDFIKTYLDDEFEIVPQWYNDVKYPILCKVKENGWSDYKIVSIKSRSGVMMQTNFGESYILRYGIKIVPLSKEECLEIFYKEEVSNGIA